jgi:hypothetical protein
MLLKRIVVASRDSVPEPGYVRCGDGVTNGMAQIVEASAKYFPGMLASCGLLLLGLEVISIYLP